MGCWESDGHDTKYVHIHFSPPSLSHPKIDFFIGCCFFLLPFVCGGADFIFEQYALSSFFYHSTFSLFMLCGAVFRLATDFNGDLSTWDVGNVTTMSYSTYTLTCIPSFSKIHVIVIFFCLLFPAFFLCTCIGTDSFLNNDLFLFFPNPL